MDGCVLVDDKAVSRRHAELCWDRATRTYTLEHISTTNFSWVNDQPVEKSAPLALGDHIKVGTTVLVLEAESESPPAPEPSSKPAFLAGSAVEKLEPPRPLTLRQEPAWTLKALTGPDSGKAWTLTGLYLTLGKDNLPHKDLVGKNDGLAFDLMIELAAPGCRPNHLVLRWNELETAYTAWKNPSAPPIPVRRVCDGVIWQGLIKDLPAMLRVGDIIQVGETTLGLEKP
jgi:hypothetical protein